MLLFVSVANGRKTHEFIRYRQWFYVIFFLDLPVNCFVKHHCKKNPVIVQLYIILICCSFLYVIVDQSAMTGKKLTGLVAATFTPFTSQGYVFWMGFFKQMFYIYNLTKFTIQFPFFIPGISQKKYSTWGHQLLAVYFLLTNHSPAQGRFEHQNFRSTDNFGAGAHPIGGHLVSRGDWRSSLFHWSFHVLLFFKHLFCFEWLAMNSLNCSTHWNSVIAINPLKMPRREKLNHGKRCKAETVKILMASHLSAWYLKRIEIDKGRGLWLLGHFLSFMLRYSQITKLQGGREKDK